MINPQKAVEWYRQRFNTEGLSDYDIYESVKQLHPDLDYMDNPFGVKQELQIPTLEEAEENTNPSFFEKLATMNLSEAYADESDWWAEAYNKSIAGTMHQIIHGEAKYEVGDVKREWYDEVGQFFVGLVSPVDFLTFFGSSGVGSIGAKAVTHGPLRNMALKGASKMMQSAGVNRLKRKTAGNAFGRYLATGAGIESGISLGTYGAVSGALHDAAQQSLEIKDPNNPKNEMDYWQMTWNATKHGMSSAVLGAGAGYVTKGLMAPKFAKAKMATNPTFGNKVTRLTMNPIGQVAAEGSVFGTGQIAERALMGEELDMDDWLSSIFMNTAIVGGLRASMKPLRMAENDVVRYKRAKLSFYGDLAEKLGLSTKVYKPRTFVDNNGVERPLFPKDGQGAKEYTALEKIEADLADSGIATPREIIQKKTLIESEAREGFLGIPQLEKNLKRYNELLSKIDEISKLPSRKERRAARAELVKEFGAVHLSLYEMYKQMRGEKEKYFSQEELATEKQRKAIDAELDTKIKSLEEVNDMVNMGALNDPAAVKRMRERYAEDSLEASVKEIKNEKGEVVGYKPVLTTAKGNEVTLPEATVRKTYNEAITFANKIKDSFKEEAFKEKPKEKLSAKEKEDVKTIDAEEAPKFQETGVEYEVIPSKPKGKETKTEPVKIEDPTISYSDTEGKKLDWLIKQEEKRQEREYEVRAISDKIPMSKKQLNDKISNKNKFTVIKRGDKTTPAQWNKQLINETKNMSTEERTLVKIINAKDKTGELSRNIIENRGDFDSSAFIDYAKARLSGNIGKATVDLKSGVIKNPKQAIIEVARFLNEYKGKDLTEVKISDLNKFFNENIPGRKIGNTTSNKPSNELALFFKYLGENKFLDIPIASKLKEFARDVVSEFNEWSGEGGGKSPAKKGIRKFVIDEAIASGDIGVEIVGKLGARYYIRNSEINKLAEILKENPKDLKKYLNFDNNTQEYFINMRKGITKYNTFQRKIWIDKLLAEDIIQYIDSGKSLVGKAAKVGQLINKGKMSDNQKSAFYDLRRRGKSIGAKLGEGEAQTEKYLFGHERTRIDRVYNIKETSELIKLQKELHKKLGSPIEPSKEFRLVSKGEVAAPIEVHRARERALMGKYPEMVVDIVKEFKDKNIPENAVGYLEKVEKWTIAVKKGKAPADVIPHEVAHYAFHLIESMNNHYKNTKTTPPKQAAKTLKLYDQAQKIFVNEKGKFVNEDAALMVGKAMNKQLDAPMMSKVTGWIKRFNMWLKSVFNKPYTKDEIAYALGTRIIKREGIPAKDITGLQTSKEFRTVTDFQDGQAFGNFIGREIREVTKEHNLPINDFIEFVARHSGIEKPERFHTILKKIQKKKYDETSLEYSNEIKQLNDFYNTFGTILEGGLKDYIGKKDALRKMNLITEIEYERAYKKGITVAEQREMLNKVFGVEEGNIYKASVEQLQKYREYVIQKEAVKRDNLDWTSMDDIRRIHSTMEDGIIKNLIKEGNLWIGTVHSAVGRIGAKDLQSKLLSHYNIENANSTALSRFTETSLKEIGGNPFTRQGKLNKMQDNMVIALDNNGEMLLGLQKASEIHGNKLPKGERKIIRDAQTFFDKAIKPEWKQTIKTSKDGKRSYGDGLAAKNKDGSYKYINTNTKEGRVAVLYIEKIQNAFGKDKFESSLRQNTDKAQFEAITSKTGIKFIEDGIYMTRNLTNEGKRLLAVDSRARERAINRFAVDISYQRAKKKYGKNFTEEQRLKEMDDSRLIAQMQFEDMLHFNPSKISIRYLKDRFSLQDLFVENEQGKLVRVYEHKFDKTIVPYVQGMSKFYATLEMFPQAIQGMLPGNGVHKVLKLAQAQLGGAKQKELNWIYDVVKKQLGVEKSSEPYEITYRTLESTARIVAKAGLSFPTAGLKNLVTGTTQTVFAHRLTDIARGFGLVLARDAEVYNRALNSNAYSIGNVLYEGATRFDRILDSTAFKAGFMKPTEKFNRLLAIGASIADQRRQINRLDMYPKGHRIHEKALDRLKTFYFLTDKEIKTIKKYGSSKEVKADNKLSNYDKVKLMREVENINNKMNTYAHVNTQGSSADLFMPKWAGKEGLRPLTLFKRMAFAATDNTQRNIAMSLRDVKRGNITSVVRPVMGVTAAYLSGKAMMGVYWELLGTAPPGENSDWWRRFSNTLWKGEFLGIMSEVFSPYDEGFKNTIHPAIFNTMGTVFMETGQLIKGTSNFEQFGEGLMRGTFSAYANSMKVIERRNNPLNRDRLRYGNLYRDYMKERGKPVPEEIQRNELSPYYEDFKNAFYLGTEEEFAKQFYMTFFAVAHDRVRYGQSMDAAFKEAESIMKSKLKTLNPNKGSLFKSSKEGIENSKRFIKWLQQHPDAKNLTLELFEAEIKYKKRLKQYKSKLKHHAKKLNIKDIFNSFNWETEKRF